MKQITAILLAAGFASRFGSNKLLCHVDGEVLFSTMLKKVLAADSFSEVIVVTQYDEIAEMAGRFEKCRIVRNLSPEEGIASSIRLGVEVCCPEDAMMFFVCDQPYLAQDTILQMVQRFESGILCPVFGQRRGNPVIFDSMYRKELLSLTGDEGGRQILRRHEEDVMFWPVAQEVELWDLDRWEDCPSEGRKPL